MSSVQRRRSLGHLLLLASVCFSCSCTGGGSSEKILSIGNGAEPATLDPHLATGVVENRIINALFEGLVGYHPKDDFALEPGVAETWSSDPDARRWVFRLREDARWSNSDPVTAHDFVFGWRRMLSPSLGAQYASMLYLIEGAEAYHTGTQSDFTNVGVRALDDFTLEVHLKGPAPHFPLMLTHYAFFPAHAPTLEAHGATASRGSGWTRPENIVANGPFVIASWRPGQLLEVKRSDTYWDADNVKLDGIRFLPIQSVEAEERAFLAGQIHITNTVSNVRIPYYQERDPESLRIDPYLGIYFYRLNTTRPGLSDPRVRRALSLAIDRGGLAEQILKAGQRPAGSFVPPMELYPPIAKSEYDVELARQLLADAGYPGGQGFPRLELLFNTLEDHLRIAEAIQSMWKQNLGIDVSLTNQEWMVYLSAQDEMNYDIARAGWIGDFPDPVSFLELWTSTSGNNQTGWSDPAYDALLESAAKGSDARERLDILRQAEAIFLEGLPAIPLYYYTLPRLIHPKVHGWHPKLLDGRSWKHIALDD